MGWVLELQRQPAALQVSAQHGSVRRFCRCLLLEVDEGAVLLREHPDGLDLPEPAEAALQHFLGDLEGDVPDPQRIAVPGRVL